MNEARISKKVYPILTALIAIGIFNLVIYKPNYPKYNYSELYSFLSKQRPSTIINFDLQTLGSWRPNFIISNKVYDKDSKHTYLNNTKYSELLNEVNHLGVDTFSYYDTFIPLKRINKQNQLIVLTHRTWSNEVFFKWLSRRKNTKIFGRSIGKIAVTSFANLNDFMIFLTTIKENSTNFTNSISYIYELKLLYHYLQNDIKSFNKVLTEFKHHNFKDVKSSEGMKIYSNMKQSKMKIFNYLKRNITQ
jgi:hypothetical protein